MAGIESHGHRTTGPDTLDAARGPLDVGRVDVAAGHDDDVLDAAAHHHVSFIGDVAEVAGVVPAVLVLGRDETAHGDVAGCQRFATQLDHTDPARRHYVAVLVDDACLEVCQQRTQRGQPAGVALGRGH